MNGACCSLVRAALKRFGEALQRRRGASPVVSLERARTPHTPRGVRSSDAPGFAGARARASAQANGSPLAEIAADGRGNAGRWPVTFFRVSDVHEHA